jgi:hypothetical protein
MIGATEEYGYQCEVCEVTWPVMIYAGTSSPDPSGHKPDPVA